MNSFLTCPDCGGELELGAIDVVQDCTNYVRKFSQVCGIIILPDEAPLPSDWTDPAEWGLVIDNAITMNVKGRYLVGEGEIGEPDGDLAEYPKRKLRVVNRVYTVELTVKNLSSSQYEFLRQIQCGWTGFHFWIETVGGRLFGGPAGIDPLTIDVAFLYSGGRDDKEEALLTLQYESDGDPPRADITGLSDAVAGAVTLFAAFGPVAGGDTAFGPVAGDGSVFAYEE